MRSFFCTAIALAMACSCASAYASGDILLVRPVNGVFPNGTLGPMGTGLFSVDDHGHHLRQLTPLLPGAYYMPSWVAFNNYTTGVDYWLTKNFSPDGRSILYFQNPSADPADGQYSGKYYIENVLTGATHPLFAGSNDNAAPGYGYLARDPANGNIVAYTNSTSEYPVTPACVYLMHTDGTHQQLLWCAPADISLPDYPSWPLQAVESIRWSGNGQKLMVYASYEPPPLGELPRKPALASPRSLLTRPTSALFATNTATGPVEGSDTGWSALFVVDVATGTGVEVAANIVDPPSGDISYDGTKVIYEQYDYAQCGDEDQEALGDSLCFKDLTTGTVTDLLAPTVWNNQGDYNGWWRPYWYPEIVLSADGSKAAFTMLQTMGYSEADLFTINTDGTNLRQLTSSATAPAAYTGWTPVAWSPDGTRILANRATLPVSGSLDQTWPSDVHIINASTGGDTFVTKGYAVDWHEKP
jgi:hypothetical protein